jgi:aminoglycoside phosphotransferase (APT) family kinase protein
MPLPEHTNIPIDMISCAAEHHGLPSRPITRLPDTGTFNAVYLVGDNYVLRVPGQHPAHFRAIYIESIAVPLARGAGVRTPAFLVYDDAQTLLPVPYTMYECVHGDTLGHLEIEPTDVADVWRELGTDLANLHACVQREGPAATLEERDALPDPRELAEELASGGRVTGSEARRLVQWLDRIAPIAQTGVQFRLCHGDTQATNVMIDRTTRSHLAVLDRGSAGWSDPAWDFAGVPLCVVPYLLAGYRTVVSLPSDSSSEAQILWRQVQLALFTARRDPRPTQLWAERPLTMLIDVARFFLTDPADPCRDLRPD